MTSLIIGGEPQYVWKNLDEPGASPVGKSCVKVQMRPATGADQGIAETNARAHVTQIVSGDRAASDYALEHADWAQAIADGDASLFSGIGYILYAVELAMLIGREMGGVVDPNGKAAPWDRRHVSMLMQSRRPGASALNGMASIGSTYADSFMLIALEPARRAAKEGKR